MELLSYAKINNENKSQFCGFLNIKNGVQFIYNFIYLFAFIIEYLMQIRLDIDIYRFV